MFSLKLGSTLLRFSSAQNLFATLEIKLGSITQNVLRWQIFRRLIGNRIFTKTRFFLDTKDQ
ncbi:MAG: hypothetical protein CMH67_01170 [Nisaea sp.]|nr:hypothetical protein [Nisaea sp.]OUY00043.1 MAG: hypothetical protein CBB86_01290 [Candidatus Endolissoclinum sp. TMED26]